MKYPDPDFRHVVARLVSRADDALADQLSQTRMELCPTWLFDRHFSDKNLRAAGSLDLLLYLRAVEDFLSGDAWIDFDFLLKSRSLVIDEFRLAGLLN